MEETHEVEGKDLSLVALDTEGEDRIPKLYLGLDQGPHQWDPIHVRRGDPYWPR